MATSTVAATPVAGYTQSLPRFLAPVQHSRVIQATHRNKIPATGQPNFSRFLGDA